MLYQSNTIQVDWIKPGIAKLIFNSPNAINKFDIETINSLNQAIDSLENKNTLSQLKGLILISQKSAFIVGADIKQFLSLFNAPKSQLQQWLNFANSIFNRIEDLPIPTVTAISGYALGGGCECALTTDYRIAAPDLKIGLPEVKLGIMPGFGGSVRLPRLIGLDNALQMITTGKDIDATTALKNGLIDAIVAKEQLLNSALLLLENAIANKLDWRQVRQPKTQRLKLNKIEQTMSFNVAKGLVMKAAGSHYPAPLTALETIKKAANCGRKEALLFETEAFIPLTQSPEAHALIRVFLNDQYVKNLAKQRSQSIETPIKTAVIGAGIMGGGIAYQSARKGVPIIMKDISEKSLQLGMNEAAKLLNNQFERKQISALEMAKILSSITPTLNYAGIENAQVIVEAVVEDPKVKTVVLAETEKLLNEHALLAWNTSTIPITKLASVLQRPENFCGMHFFNPVHRMPLVEIIKGEKTSAKTIDTITAYANKMGKTAIIVNDCPGFFVNRVLFPYFSGFNLLLQDGADFYQIDKIMERQFGWPMGPAYLIDVIGIDTVQHAQQVMAESFPARMTKIDQDAISVLFNHQRYGQKNGVGFYQYVSDKKGKIEKQRDPKINDLLGKFGASSKQFTEQDIIMRMMIPMINEVVRCLDEHIIASPAEADIALVYGLGFPPFRGGAICYLDNLGIENYIKLAEKYASLGPLYTIPTSLKTKAEKHASYYPAPEKITFNSK